MGSYRVKSAQAYREPSILIAREGVSVSEWNRVVDESSNGLPFHLYEWLEVLSETQRLTLKRYGLYTGPSFQQLVGVMPLLVGKLGPFRVAGSPFVVEDTPYMGPVIAEHLMPDALKAVQATADGKKAMFLRVLLPYMPSEDACRNLTEFKFTCGVKHTHILNLLKGVPALWNNMEGRCRTAVRRAEKSGVEIVRVDSMSENRSEIESYYRLVEDVYGRQGRKPPNPPELYHRLWEKFHAQGVISLLMARMHGSDIAGVLLAHYKNRVYYLDGASDRIFAKLCPTNLLLWKAIEWAASEGYREFDFVGSDIPRLANFKASFGGEITEYLCLEWARSKPIGLFRNWYGRYGKPMFEQLRFLFGKFREAS